MLTYSSKPQFVPSAWLTCQPLRNKDNIAVKLGHASQIGKLGTSCKETILYRGHVMRFFRTVYDGGHTRLQKLDSFDANLNSTKRKFCEK